MKTFILVILLSLYYMSSTLFAQPKFQAPLGLTFGSDIATVKSVLKSKGAIYVAESKEVYGVNLKYTKIKIGSLFATIGTFDFVNNKLYGVNFSFTPTHNNEIQSTYNEICKIITDKYGEGQSTRQFKYPYTDGADDMIIAIERGYADIDTLWILNIDDAIIVSIYPIDMGLSVDLGVSLYYQYGALRPEAKEKEKGKNNKDF